jgi:putative hydrolase of the HAD superfamily
MAPVSASTRVRAVICDWAGVLTNSVPDIVSAYCETAGVTPQRIGAALAAVAERDGHDPFAQLELGRISEETFLTRVADALARDGDAPVDLSAFRSAWFAGVRPNDEFVSYIVGLRRRQVALALLTNNVREWDAEWRAKLAPLHAFSVVVTSFDEGVRKPDPEIFRRTLSYLELPASACLFVDDSLDNCKGAEAAGLHAVWFRSTEQAVAAIEARLAA